MSEESEKVAEVLSLVDEAQKRGKFDLISAIKGRAYPEKEVIVYTDAVAAIKLFELNDKMNKAAARVDLDEFSKLENESKELIASVESSKLIFKMVGLPQEKVDEIGDAIDSGTSPTMSWSRDYIAALVAASIVSVTDHEGNVDEREFTHEDGKSLYKILPSESWMKLSEAVEQLTLATGIFKGITDAGFLQKS